MLKLKRLWKEDEEIPAETAGELAGQFFDQNNNCAQAVLRATTGIEDREWLGAAQAFGGGIGGTKCLCGAVAGGVMALGARGKGGRADRLVSAFKKRNRMTCCKGLSAPYRWMSREHRANCRRITVETADLVAGLLELD